MFYCMNVPYLPFGSPTTPLWNRYWLGHMLRIFSYDPAMSGMIGLLQPPSLILFKDFQSESRWYHSAGPPLDIPNL